MADGVHLPQWISGFGHFYAGLRYNMGMDGLGSAPLLDDVKNRQVQAYVGIGLFKPTK